ncbi:MAG TPA: O-antigen ligase family protein [Terriglobales bacterium]|nr:O-antigen ligase family protein [Terriglobales bacterium]
MSTALATPPQPAPVTKVSQPRITNLAVLGAAWAVLLAAPLAFGAVEPWSIFALETASLLLLGLWAARQWMNRELIVVDNALYLPMAAFFALVLLQRFAGLTAYRHVTFSNAMLYAAYGMLAFVVSQALRRSSQFEMMAQAITVYGAVVSAFAVLQGMAPNGKLYWIWSLEQGGAIYGPYVNHNHYAGLMEMLTPFPLVLAATHFTEGNRKTAAAGVAALMAASVFLSGSRGGMVALVVQFIVLGLLLARKRGDSWKQALVLGVILSSVIVFLVWLGGNELTRRLASIHSEAREEISGGVRMTIDRDCFRMFLKKPLLGWGLGTFPVVYPEFRSFYTTFFVNEAHNDYLQLLVETGLAGFSIAVWFMVVVIRRAKGKLNNWTETATGSVTVAALLGIMGILVHSFVDFNLQIPANAAVFFVLCAIAASSSLEESKRRRVARRHNLIVQPTFDPTVAQPKST